MTEYAYPRSEWLRGCPVPVFQGEKNRDLLVYAERLETALGACNADKQALREWRESHRESED